MNHSFVTQSQTQKLLTQLQNIKCKTHPFQSITKICKHPTCYGQPPLCNLCLVNHEVMHFNLFEDIELLLNPKKIIQIKEIANAMKQRLEIDTNEAETKANPRSMIAQFEKCIELNKAKLVDCFLRNVITRKNEEIKGELKSFNDKLNRKYKLIVETNGQDEKIVQDFLLTYVRATARFKEIGKNIDNQSDAFGTEAIAKKYLQGVEELFESVKRYTVVKLEEASKTAKVQESANKAGNSFAESVEQKKESAHRAEESNMSSSDEEDCKIIGAVSRSSNKWRQSEKAYSDVKEPQLHKKIKYNTAKKSLGTDQLEESKINSNFGDKGTIECKTSGKLCVCLPN